MAEEALGIWRSSFHPDSDTDSLATMRKAFYDERRAQGNRSLAICGKVVPDSTRRSIGNGMKEVLVSSSDGTGGLFVDPVFTAWTHFLSRAVIRRDEHEIKFHCSNIEAVMERVKARLAGEEPHYISRTRIAVQRTDIDPYIMAATPPSYDFQATLGMTSGMNGQGHPLAMQTELLGLALDNIEQAWSELHTQIEDVVKIVGYLPDASFRSCSAARYAGVVYLGNMDERVLDIEESIVHEAGHQVLYRLGGLVPLVREDAPKAEDYTLPWSGSKRDLFGFLHAFYIYTLLTKYFWRRACLNNRERKDCVTRAVLILLGTIRAIPMLIGDADLSPQGRHLVEVLADDMKTLKTEIEGALGALPSNNND